MHLVDQHNQIVTQNLTKRFVDHGNVSLTAQAISEFSFHHAERGFDVRALFWAKVADLLDAVRDWMGFEQQVLTLSFVVIESPK